jgi:hypothetical protein
MLKAVFAATAAAALAFGALASEAAARDGERIVTRSGTCSAGSRVSIKAKLDDGRLETEAEVDQNRVGRLWRVSLVQNGRTVFTGTRRTNARSGSFEVRRLLANRAGADRISVRATAVAGGEVCRAALSY